MLKIGKDDTYKQLDTHLFDVSEANGKPLPCFQGQEPVDLAVMDGVALVLFSSTREREDKGFYHFYKKDGKWTVHDDKLDQLPYLSFATNVQFDDIDLD